MTSKLEYLQRYMSHSSENAADGTDQKRKKVKKVKKVKAAALRVVDIDDEWKQSAPSKEDIDKKWELDVAEDDQPIVVAADGDEIVDIQDLPVYVDSDKYLDEFQGQTKERKITKDNDLSLPRKIRGVGRRGSSHDDDEASPPRRPKNEDASPPRRRSNATHKSSERKKASCEEGRENTLTPKRQRREERSEDGSPPKRPARRDQDSDAFQLRHDRKKTTLSQHARGDVVLRSHRPPVKRNFSVEDTDNTSPPKKSRGSKRDEERSQHSPDRSPAASDRHRRVDSLGRDIPPRPIQSERRSFTASIKDDTSSRHRTKKTTRSRSNSQGGDRGRDRNEYASSSSRSGLRKNRSRSQCDSRSPSVRRQGSPRKSTRWGPPRRDESTRGRSHSCSRSKHGLTSSSRRSRSRSSSLKRRSSRRDSVDVATYDASKGSSTAVKSSKRSDLKSNNADASKPQKDPNIETYDDKEGRKAGLFTTAEFDQQRKIAAKQNDILRGLDASEMGANAKTVYRDKRGRKLDMLNEMVRQQEVLDGKRKREEREEYEWGTGEVQKQEHKSQLDLMEQMKKTPFARHEDDEELERRRRGRIRAFDPLNSKIFQEDPLAEGSSKKKKKDKKVSKVKRRYAGPPAPPNRFGIMPGYRWDGVVRGTNWEEKIMMRQNANTAVSEEAYKYAVADM